MKKRLVALICMITFIFPAAVQAEEVSLEKKARNIAASIVENYGADSIQYALIDQGEIILSGYSQSGGSPVTSDTLYGIGSVSKVYVTAAVMQLVEQGLVDLDESLTAYITDFKMKDSRYKQITPRMLMNHSSGIYGTNHKNSFTLGQANTKTHDQLLEWLAKESLKADPGEYAVYCNDGFTLLEILVERVAKMGFSQYFSENISQPLGLLHTKTSQDVFEDVLLADIFWPGFGALPADKVNAIGAGGFYASAEDMCLLAPLFMGQAPEVLSYGSAAAMWEEEYRRGLWVEEDEGFAAYGLGWDSVYTYPFHQNGIQAVSKGGDTIFNHASLIIIPEHQVAMAVVSSGGSSIFNGAFASAVLESLLIEKGVIESPVIEAINTAEPVPMEESMKAYSGFYGIAMTEGFDIVIGDGRMELPGLMGLIPSQQYSYIGNGRFQSEDGAVIASFETLENGHTYLKTDILFEMPGIGQTKLVLYSAQKLDLDPLSGDVLTAWQARAGQNYYILDDAYNSQLYLAPLIAVQVPEDIRRGYVMGSKVIDENNAVNTIQIPIMAGRDTADFHFYTPSGGGKEYLAVKGFTMIAQKDIPALSAGSQSASIIGADGYNRWYQIDENTAGKQIAVRYPEKLASWAVYDQDDMLVYFSVIEDTQRVTLPQGGKVVFMGQPGDAFLIDLE